MTDRSVSLAAANAYALGGALPVLALLIVPFGLAWGWTAVADGALWWADRPLVMLGALVVGVLVHEVLHALTWRAMADLPPGSVRLGFSWKALTPYAHCSAPMPARAYRLGAAAPGVALGLAPVGVAWATGDGLWLAFGLLFTLAAGGDALILWLLRDAPPDVRVADHPTRAGCLVLDAREEPPTAPASLGGITDSDPMASSLHSWPDATDRSADWAAGVSYETFLPTAEDNVDLWTRTWERAATPPDVLARVAAVPGAWCLLVLSEDWCGDASNTVPHLARLAAEAPSVELRLLARDEHLDLMDEHLTGGTARSIPVVIVLDDAGRERGWWGSRPTVLHELFTSDALQAMEKDDRYRELRKWYARDHGRTTLDEVVTLIETAAGEAAGDAA